jgi:erythromycin esterase
MTLDIAGRFPAAAAIVSGGILACAGGVSAAADARLESLRQVSQPVRSIAPDDVDFSDLMPLVEKIGNARIVLLGEGSHGEGSTFLAKARMVRFLHQEMGFDVLAWESGLFDCEEVDRAMRSELSAYEAAQRGIFPVWSRSKQTQPLFEYVKATQATDRPIVTAGFDCQISSNRSTRALPEALLEYFDRVSPGLLSAPERDRLRDLVGRLADQRNERYKPDLLERRDNRDLLHKLAHNVALDPAATDAATAALIERWLYNLLVLEERNLPRQDEEAYFPVFNLRDAAMGANLVWLARERYPDRKIMVWAATLHSARSVAPLQAVARDRSVYAGLVPMGHYLHRALGRETYIVSFMSARGRAGWASGSQPDTEVSPPSPGSLLELCSRIGQPRLFIDLKGLDRDHWLRRPFALATPAVAQWSQIFDGVFFVDEMTPSMPATSGH